MPDIAGEYAPYGRTLRRLHLGFIIFTAVLATTGFMIYFREPLGVRALKLKLVYFHAITAYGLVALIVWRIVLFFRGASGERWRSVLVDSKSAGKLFGALSLRNRGAFAFAGRSPLSRMIATVFYLALVSNMASGLIRAGTDIYYPPFGGFLKAYVAADGIEPGSIRRGSPDGVDKVKEARVKRAALLFGRIHIYGAFLIAGLAFFHAGGALATEWSVKNSPASRGRARIMLFGPVERRSADTAR